MTAANTDESSSPARAPARRVLHIGKYFPPHPGGMETYLRDLMNAQARVGVESMALVHASKRRLFDRTIDITNHEGHHYAVREAGRLATVGFVPLSPLFPFSLGRAIAQFRPDILHLHLPNASALFALTLPAARSLPWIITWQSDVITPISSPLMRGLYHLYRPLEQWLLRRSRKILVSSSAYRDNSAALAAHLDKVELVPLGLDWARLPDPNTVEPLPRGPQPIILAAGRLAHYKGLEVLIQACAQLPDVELWIAGDGDRAERLKALAKTLLLADRIRFWHDVDDAQLWQLYRSADVFCLASTDRTESFGMVLLEAAHFGCPLVTTQINGSGVAWVARQFERATIAPSNDVPGLAAAISAALSTQGSRAGPVLSRDQQKRTPNAHQDTLDLDRQVQLINKIYASSC